MRVSGPLLVVAILATALAAFDLARETRAGFFPQDYVVDTTDDDPNLNTCNNFAGFEGDCSLRGAINNANTDTAPSNIYFNIDALGGAKFRFTVLGDLPAITQSVLIDGYSQPGTNGPCHLEVGQPCVLMTGEAGSPATNGFTVSSTGVTIRGMVIYGFTGNGILINSGANALITGNYIGTSDGTNPNNGNGSGIFVAAGGSATIGGDTDLERNLISRNNTGINLLSETDSTIQGNFIGTTSSGEAALGNVIGIYSAEGDIIGGDLGLGLANIISGNDVGIQTVSGSVIKGNAIGTNVLGTMSVGNGTGIEILGGDNIVGGTGGSAGNLIAGNNGLCICVGVKVSGGQNNLIAGNEIGLITDGPLANVTGIEVGPLAEDTTIGGTTAEARNVISGNSFGITISGSTGTVVQGNYIGTNFAGTAAVPNVGLLSVPGYGIAASGATNLTIGGTSPGARNVISGNDPYGIYLGDQDGALIEGNYIGLNAAGTQAIPNLGSGISLLPDPAGESADNNVITNNVLSGNGLAGIELAPASGTTTNSNDIVGNIIGLNAAGDAAVPNQGAGVYIATLNGGVAQGNLVASGNSSHPNVISGNAETGVALYGEGTDANFVSGNFIGTNDSGSTPLGNGDAGVDIRLGADENFVTDNTITANDRGILIGDGSNTETGNGVFNNYIGTNADLDPGLGNNTAGVAVGSTDNDIGNGSVPAAGPGPSGNVIRNNVGPGVSATVDGVTISANSIDDNTGKGIDRGASLNPLAPHLTSAEASGNGTHVVGTLENSPGQTDFTIEFFSSPACDASGAGEGRNFLGSVQVHTGNTGSATIDTNVALAAGGEAVTATTTGPDGGTSEFSECVTATGPTPSPTQPATPTPTGAAVISGDANCDGAVDEEDVLAILEELAGVGEGAPCSDRADVDCDGDVDAQDALRILLFVAGVPLPQPSGCPEIGP